MAKVSAAPDHARKPELTRRSFMTATGSAPRFLSVSVSTSSIGVQRPVGPAVLRTARLHLGGELVNESTTSWRLVTDVGDEPSPCSWSPASTRS